MVEPSQRVGPYRIIERIGEGGFGEVFAAVEELTKQRVALKVLRAEHAQDGEKLRRFLQEANALAQFDGHAGIVKVYHHGRTDDGRPYLAMELLTGQTLRKWFAERAHSLSLDEALQMAQQIACTMVDVHAKNVVHRDLKPANIMVVEDERAPFGVRPMVMDFGIAKIKYRGSLDDQSLTLVKTGGTDVVGSLQYMAPEQFLDADGVDIAADVYVLGLVVYELIAGKLPFQPDDDVQWMLMHCRDIPQHLSDVVPMVPQELSTFIASMLAKTPRDRPSMRTCHEMFARDWTHARKGCPFPGLQPFDDSHAYLFFGRQEETKFIRAKLDEIREGQRHRWFQVQGPSGVGKSSLVHAALRPRLASSKQWCVVVLRPADNPIRSLAVALAKQYDQDAVKLEAELLTNPEALGAFVQAHHASEACLLLIVDQFEELFALGGAQALATFEGLWANAFAQPRSRLRLLTTIRSDYVHRFDQAPGLARLLDQRAIRYDLRAMDENALAEVVKGMASRAGLRLSDGLSSAMVRDAAGTDCRLPLLAHALRSLWVLRTGGEITAAHYADLGGVGGALTKHVELLLGNLSAREQEQAKWLILDLVQIGQGAPDTCRPRTRAEVLRAAGEGASAENVLQRLSGIDFERAENTKIEETEPFRLVVIAGDSADDSAHRVELVHEMVLHKVPIVVEWIRAERQMLELLVALESAALTWHKTPKKDDGMPSGTLLDHYRGGERASRVWRMASLQAQKFLSEATRLEVERHRRQNAIRAFLLFAVLAIALSAAFAWRQKMAAEKTMRAFQEINQEIVSDVDWELSWHPDLADTRRSMLEHLDRNLQALEKEDAALVRRSLVETKQRQSEFARGHESLATSFEFLIEARRRIDVALQEDPNGYEYQKLLAINHSKHGKLLLAQGKSDGAFGDCFTSVELLEALRQKEHNFDEQVLATSRLECGDAELSRNHGNEALAWYEKAIEARKEQAAASNDAYWISMLADALVRKARAALAIGNAAVARASLEQARQIQEPVAKAKPFNHFYYYILGKIDLGFMALEQYEQHWQRALDNAEDAGKIGRHILKGDITNKDYALLLIESLAGVESITSALVEPTKRDEAHDQRCKLVEVFIKKDTQDIRFKKFACQ